MTGLRPGWLSRGAAPMAPRLAGGIALVLVGVVGGEARAAPADAEMKAPSDAVADAARRADGGARGDVGPRPDGEGRDAPAPDGARDAAGAGSGSEETSGPVTPAKVEALPQCRYEEEEDEEDARQREARRAARDERERQRKRYRKALERYEKVAQDYQETAHERIRERVEEQKKFVKRTMSRRLEELRYEEKQRRARAIERFEHFVERYPNAEDFTPDAMFRLAELYYEHAKIRFQEAREQYEEDMDLYRRGKIPARPEPPERDFSETVRVYRELVDRFGTDYRYADAVLYLLGYVQNEQRQYERAEKAWTRLVERFPDSSYAPECHLRIGEMHFDLGEFEEAEASYEEAVEYGDSRYYDKALYKLGWSYFQQYDYDRAIKTFKKLIAYYDEAETDGGATASALREEAVDYLAASLAEDDWNNDGLPDDDAGVDRALSYLDPDEASDREIIRSYAGSLVDLADEKKWNEAIRVYRHLIETKPLGPKAPEHQKQIVRIYDRMREIEKATAERRKLAERFGVGSEWWEAHREDAKLRKRIGGMVEKAMRNRALWHHQRAQELKLQARNTGDKKFVRQSMGHYREAAQAYRDYLERYPDEPKSYKMRFFLAESLWYSQQYERAASVYEEVAKNPHKDDYRVSAAWSWVKSEERLIDERAEAGEIPQKVVPGSEWSPPKRDDDVDAEKVSDEVQRVEAEPVPEPVQAWLDAVEFYVSRDFADEGTRKPKSRLAYQTAEILYRLRDYDAARDRYQQVISCYPEQEVAANAAANIINSYREENDWSNLEKWANIAERLDLGKPEQQERIRQQIRIFKLGAVFQKAQKLYQQEKWLPAAEEFERIARENPDAEIADKALFNAALAYKKVDHYQSAARLFEKLVREERYADSEFTEEALLELGDTRRLFFEFERAISAYRSLYERFPEGDNRRYALYQIAEQHKDAGNLRKAAQQFRRYADEFPERDDAAGALVRAARLYEELEDPSSEREVWNEFLDRYEEGSERHALVLEGVYRLGELDFADGRKERAKRRWKRVTEEFEERELEPGTRAATFAARAQFEIADYDYREYAEIKLTSTNQTKARKKIKRKQELLSVLEEGYDKVLPYDAVEWTIAAAYRKALIYKGFADTLYGAPRPEGLTRREMNQYVNRIQDLGLKFENVAIKRFEKTVEQSRRLKVSNDWATKALRKVSKYKPEKYPVYRPAKRRMDFDAPYHLDHAADAGGESS